MTPQAGRPRQISEEQIAAAVQLLETEEGPQMTWREVAEGVGYGSCPESLRKAVARARANPGQSPPSPPGGGNQSPPVPSPQKGQHTFPGVNSRFRAPGVATSDSAFECRLLHERLDELDLRLAELEDAISPVRPGQPTRAEVRRALQEIPEDTFDDLRESHPNP